MTISLTTSTISEVLTALLEATNITESELSRRINMPRATINKIKAGKIIDPRSSTILAIANYFQISTDQLLGKVPLYSNQYQLQKHSTKIVSIPLFDWKDIEKITNNSKNINFTVKPIRFISIEYTSKAQAVDQLFALQVYGDAMWPYFDEETTIIIDKSLEVKNRKYVVAYIASIRQVVLRQVFIEGNLKILRALHKIFKPIQLHTEDRIIGVVVHVKKDL